MFRILTQYACKHLPIYFIKTKIGLFFFKHTVTDTLKTGISELNIGYREEKRLLK